jgi:hypothetical protein
MATTNNAIGCPRGDSFVFAIEMQPNADGSQPDLTGATAEWYLAEGQFDGAKKYVTKTNANGIVISKPADKWLVLVPLDPVDTANVPAGTYFQQCKVTLQDSGVDRVESGPFVLSVGL